MATKLTGWNHAAMLKFCGKPGGHCLGLLEHLGCAPEVDSCGMARFRLTYVDCFHCLCCDQIVWTRGTKFVAAVAAKDSYPRRHKRKEK